MLLSLLLPVVLAQAPHADVPASSPTSSPALVAPLDTDPSSIGNTGPQDRFHFLCPMIEYRPRGAWTTNMLSAAANTTSNTSVSISTAASGMTFNFGHSPGELLVNGSSPDTFNATTSITTSNATISGLDYGWYNFTLVANGTATFHGAKAALNGSRWLPAQRGGMVEFNTTADTPLFTTSGEWDAAGSSTNSTGKLTIHPPGGTALLEVTQDVPSAPGGPFNVSITPPPPLQPENQAVAGSLFTADIIAAIGILNVVLFRVELDPVVDYTVEMVYAGNGTGVFKPRKLGMYRVGVVNTTGSVSPEGSGSPSGAGVRAAPALEALGAFGALGALAMFML